MGADGVAGKAGGNRWKWWWGWYWTGKDKAKNQGNGAPGILPGSPIFFDRMGLEGLTFGFPGPSFLGVLQVAVDEGQVEFLGVIGFPEPGY